MWRGMYEDFDSLHAAHSALMHLVDDLVASTEATLSRIEIHGPSDELDAPETKKFLDPSMALKAEYYDMEEGFVSRLPPSVASRASLCETNEYFTVNDWGKARPIMNDFVKQTSREKGCLYSGWSKKNNELRWRESYKDGDAMLKHFKNTAPLIDKLRDGPATLERFEIHGPTVELNKAKDISSLLKEPIKPIYFAITSGSDDGKLLKELEAISDDSSEQNKSGEF